MDILLSIVVPTLNRKDLLQTTLDELLQQIEQYKNVELIVSDNASNDGTHLLFENEKYSNSNLKYIRHETRVDIDQSFSRSVDLANGDFVTLFGDDDIAMPGYVGQVLKAITENPNCGFVYVNRIICDEYLQNCNEIPHRDEIVGIHTMNVSDFIKRFTHWPGFVTCLIFSMKVWNEKQKLNYIYPGYNFLYRVYMGSMGLKVCYIANPLIAQRRGIQSWKKFWPQYWLISMPHLLKTLEDDNVTKGALKVWQDTEITNKRFLIDSFVAKAYSYPIKSDFWKLSRSFQFSKLRKVISYFIQYFLPTTLAKYIYSKSKKMT